ncbi:uncharacterized protein BCR38DRAFT_350598 [Pseudomassariella vexata]|uniref:Uncharacterized protein n=1 Tax=Pseudomassariella vexata TaxID=1141098 RepID=A0A1Y2DL96_9PEZI|nr:uncharacterized protein BCR38DRAFT_350598 [Pseudomassariella vexata]ORY59934.1 hypothetical protein BCR38DRAFT_350598 [Pseudomassariella vexata]
MSKRSTTTSTYLQYCLESNEKQIKLLNAGFEDRRRYSRGTSPIATTWLISFQHLERTYPLAVEYLKLICFLAEKDIPTSLLPHGEDQEGEDEAVGVLRGHAFISVREQGDAFDVHRLIRFDVTKYGEAERMYQVALQLKSRVLGPTHSSTSLTSRNISNSGRFRTSLMIQGFAI